MNKIYLQIWFHSTTFISETAKTKSNQFKKSSGKFHIPPKLQYWSSGFRETYMQELTDDRRKMTTIPHTSWWWPRTPNNDISHIPFFFSLFLWKTSWLLSNASKECEVANFHGQTSDVYAYVWMVQGSLFSWITRSNLCHTLNRCKVAYFHGKRHDSYPMQWRNGR